MCGCEIRMGGKKQIMQLFTETNQKRNINKSLLLQYARFIVFLKKITKCNFSKVSRLTKDFCND